jgi:hypothetical protein
MKTFAAAARLSLPLVRITHCISQAMPRTTRWSLPHWQSCTDSAAMRMTVPATTTAFTGELVDLLTASPPHWKNRVPALVLRIKKAITSSNAGPDNTVRPRNALRSVEITHAGAGEKDDAKKAIELGRHDCRGYWPAEGVVGGNHGQKHLDRLWASGHWGLAMAFSSDNVRFPLGPVPAFRNQILDLWRPQTISAEAWPWC